MLYPRQKPIVASIVNNIEDKMLYNAPTGIGKTYIIAQAAIELTKKHKDRSVIISVPNNNLVRSMKETLDRFDFKDTSIAIGIDNYINKEALDDNYQKGILSEYITEESLSEYMEYSKDEDVLFLEDFNKIIEYKDYMYHSVVEELIRETDREKHNEALEADIIISNHYYIMSKIILAGNLDTSRFIFLFDEVHDLVSVAEATLEESFSLFELSNALKKVEPFVKKDGKLVSLYQDIKTLNTKIIKTQRKLISSSKVGMAINDISTISKYSDEINKILTSNTAKKVKTKLEEIIKSKNKDHTEIANNANYFIALLKKGIRMSTYKTIHKVVYYSPAKGYPVLKSSLHSLESIMKFKFWKNIDMFAGLSATVSYAPKPFGVESDYAYKRLGLYEKGKEHIVISYDRVFDKNKVKIFTPYTPEKESIYSDNGELKEDAQESKYYLFVVEYIYKTNMGKNSIILCGGYLEAKFLHDLYKKNYPEARTHYAKPSVKTSITLNNFREEGGILFATRNYNTGISLENKELEKLYIINLPFPIFTNLRWFSMKRDNPSYYYMVYENEMLIALMQTLGRLQRTSDDKGDIYLLDNRYDNKKRKKLKSKVFKILDFYGIVVDNKKHQKKKIMPGRKNKKESDILAALLL